MAHTTKVPLGADTGVRKWQLDVNNGTYAAPVWVGVFGISDFKPSLDPTEQDNSDLDSEGFKSSAITALAWALEIKLQRKTKATDATAYDEGQEILRAAHDVLGSSNRVDIRWYEVTTGGPKVEAYRGYASVGWSPDGGSMEDLDTVTVKLSGQGQRVAITHPDNEAAHVPVVTSCTPNTAAAAGGQVVELYGAHFTGVTAVKVGAGGTAFTSYYKLDDNHIIGVLPAKAGGTYVIEVTNATGVSTGGPTVTYS